jgi:ferredoxin--NADP+ reductase
MLEFFVVLIEEGKLTPRLWDIGVGGRLWMDSVVKGDFTLDSVPDGKDLVMFSTGTGIAPFVSMLRTFQGTQRWRRFVMVNGVRRVIDLGYRDELEQLAKDDPNFCYIPLISRPTEEDNWSGLKGRIPILLESDRFLNCAGVDLDPEQCHVFLCGNPAMIDDMEALLIERGFKTHEADSPGNIHFERYW